LIACSLAVAAANQLVDELGLSYSSLFPAGDPEKARNSIAQAAQVIMTTNNALSGQQKAIVLEVMINSLTKMYNGGAFHSNDTGVEIRDCNALLANSAQTLDKADRATHILGTAEAKLSEAGLKLSEGV
jgi:hypothetical protein